MLNIGLTGGIGSGKSTAANCFSQLGISVIDADVIAHDLTHKNTALFTSIVSHFGQDVLDKDGHLNRKKLRDLIFSNEAERQWLEELLHPAIITTMKQQIKTVASPYCILVIPLLTESNSIDFIDRICVIDIPEEIQLQRARVRDRTTESDIQAIIQSQTSRQQRLANADDIIINDGDFDQLKRQVTDLHQHYLALAKHRP